MGKKFMAAEAVVGVVETVCYPVVVVVPAVAL
jgi:hypothetical protein